MRIIVFGVTLCCFIALTHSADELRPNKKEKRQLDYQVSQYYSGPHSYRLERRISNGPQNPPLYSPSQYFPGPPRPYRKDPGQDLANNHLSDPIDRGGSSEETVYIPLKPLVKVVEKPVYIKEPEPIIEIIIKESNVTLPPPPTEAPPPPQKKKKEEVQVFYVKYKKNPNGYGKDAVIYDKPIPAISPVIPDEPEPEEEWKEPPPSSGYGAYENEVTEPPRPSTTLRTIIKPDSEVYHSPGNNVKVTFGKESFDYSKRSSKAEDYSPPTEEQYPKARQLSSFSDVYFKRPANFYLHASPSEYRSDIRPPQPYRQFSNNFHSSPNQYNSNRPPNREINNRQPPPFFPPPKYPPYSKPPSPPQSSRPSSSFPNFSHSISHPPPAQYQAQSKPSYNHQQSSNRFPPQPQFSEVPRPNQRKPVPYTPFETLRPSQPLLSPPLPAHQPHHQSFSQPQPTQQSSAPQLPHVAHNIQFRPETRYEQQPLPSTQSAPAFSRVNNQYKSVEQPQQQSPQNIQQLHHQQINQKQFNNQYNQQPQQYSQHHSIAQNVIPAGGELVQSIPRYEHHVVDQTKGQESQQGSAHQTFGVTSQQPQDSAFGLRAHKQVKNQNSQNSQQNYQQQYQKSQNEFASQQQGSNNQIYSNFRSSDQSTFSPSRKHSPTTPKPSSTTKEPEKPSTTTRDPKILEAQLPDEVPEDLRQQLLSSGILNNADISILDYDKVGDIPLSDLPPDQLANFYSAGGAQQLAAAGSEPVPQTAALTARKDVSSSQDQDMSADDSKLDEVSLKPSEGKLEMKVVKYNPDSDKGQQVQQTYIDENAKQVDPVVLNDNTYNRYLPLKVNGTQFPIPDVPELKGKLISSVVVLAPINYDFSSNRQTRETKPEDDLQFIQNEALKELLSNPSRENYRKFLENEKMTVAAKQAVILLVTGSKDDPGSEKEIYMYDIASKTVSKLSGELSSAFVEAAEANSSDDDSSEAKGPDASTSVAGNQISEDHKPSIEGRDSEGAEKLEDKK